MIRLCIYICIFMLSAVTAFADTVDVLNPKTSLKPSYEYEDKRPGEVSSSHFIKQNTFTAVPYTTVTTLNYNEVLNRLGAAEELDLTINTANAKTGIITLAFKTDQPEKYVDMGITTRTFGREEFVYPTAASAGYKLPYVNNDNDYYKVWRTTGLNCLITLQLSKINTKQTKASISVNYIFTLETSYENTAFRKKAPADEKVTVTFSTNMPQEVNLGGNLERVNVTPQSTGVLEQAILDIFAD